MLLPPPGRRPISDPSVGLTLRCQYGTPKKTQGCGPGGRPEREPYCLSGTSSSALNSTKAKELHELLAPSLASLGYELVQLRLMPSGRPTLQVLIEPAGGGSMNLDACSLVSRHISAVLDVEDPIAGAYNLEVGSPGIDRPLVKAADYERFKGEEAKIETGELIAGRKRWRGALEGITDGTVHIRVEDGADHTSYAIPLDQIVSAKLVLTDALIARDAQRRARGKEQLVVADAVQTPAAKASA